MGVQPKRRSPNTSQASWHILTLPLGLGSDKTGLGLGVRLVVIGPSSALVGYWGQVREDSQGYAWGGVGLCLGRVREDSQGCVLGLCLGAGQSLVRGSATRMDRSASTLENG